MRFARLLLPLVPFAALQPQAAPLRTNAPDIRLALRPVATGMNFPVYLTAPPGDRRLFVVEKGGLIRIIKNGRLAAPPFLDVARLISKGGEQGLLGLAFHPRYASNGIFVVNYTDQRGDTHISTFKVSGDPDRADPASEKVILTVEQPYANHNGGDVVFGPDGMLYVGMGDGGAGGDPKGHGQSGRDLLASLLRLEIRDDGTMRVPPDNPFAQRSGFRPELWDIGLRNPWRFSFDRANGDLYIGDVGQDEHEEVDVSPTATGRGRGANYGWSVYEGMSCYSSGDACRAGGFTMPVIDYDHRQGCSITGGYVYRGAAAPALRGTYFYADYCQGWVRSFRYLDGQAADRRTWASLDTHGAVTSFGEDAAGELYVMTQGGNVWQIVPAP